VPEFLNTNCTNAMVGEEGHFNVAYNNSLPFVVTYQNWSSGWVNAFLGGA